MSTKYGNVNTDHILFICSGAFHSCKPSDMLAELQGRLPIRVELKGLTREVQQPNLQIYTSHGVVIMDIDLCSLLNSTAVNFKPIFISGMCGADGAGPLSDIDGA